MKPELQSTLSDKNNIDEYHKIELAEIFNRIRLLISLRIQIFTFIGTANLTILGISISEQKAILIFLGAVLMVLLMFIDSLLRPNIDIILARGIQIENLYSDDNDALLISIMLASINKPKSSYTIALKIREAKNQNEVLKLVRSRPVNYKLGIWLPLSVAMIESVGGVLLWAFNVMPLV
ncbi:MAG: hypothetical protein ACFB0C_22155 [Leptolyngbyaceae cyanobacterium]